MDERAVVSAAVWKATNKLGGQTVSFSDEQKEEFKKAIQDRGATKPCPRCGNASFILLDGYLSPTLQTDLGKTILGGAGVPIVAVICKNCGFLSQHALGILGLLPEEVQPSSTELQGDATND